MQTFYETQTITEHTIVHDPGFGVDICWSTFAKGRCGAIDDGRHTEEDSSFYEEDDHSDPYTLDASDSVFKSDSNNCVPRNYTEDMVYIQAQCDGGNFESMRTCLAQTGPSAAQNYSDLECSAKRQPQFCSATKRRLDIERRNSRERIRVRAVNEAFLRLRRMVPATRCSPKRVSKRSTLVRAAEYIRELQQRLADASSTLPQHKSVTAGSSIDPTAL